MVIVTLEMRYMVYPYFRRKKIVTVQYFEAKKRIKGLPFSKILLNISNKSTTKIGFLQILPATLSFS